MHLPGLQKVHFNIKRKRVDKKVRKRTSKPHSKIARVNVPLALSGLFRSITMFKFVSRLFGSNNFQVKATRNNQGSIL
jgi:hypothetical protein